MGIGIDEAQVALATLVRGFLDDRGALRVARAMLEEQDEELPGFFDEMVELGWLGLHLPESVGGAGFSLAELVVVLEELGRCLAPGPLLGTVAASALIDSLGTEAQQERWLAPLASGSVLATVAFAGPDLRSGDVLDGEVLCAFGSRHASLAALVVGDDVLLVELGADGVEQIPEPSFDPTRRATTLRFRSVALSPEAIIEGRGARGAALIRILAGAEAVGVAARCLDESVSYAKEREQFGRPIGMFQAVKHHAANMLVALELATAAVWDAARAAAAGADDEQVSLAADAAGVLALSAAFHNADLNIQLHGGIGFTWEHDAHLFLRRAVALGAAVSADDAALELSERSLGGLVRNHGVELPAEAEEYRAATRAAAERIASLHGAAQRRELIDSGYLMPHWPKPFGREAPALEQLVIEEEFAKAGVEPVNFGITGWVILTLIQHGSADQVARWVRPTLEGEWIWCQLFSEPDAGSDAAAVRTRGERVEGGWLVTGQKVWTSGAHQSRWGFATVRTDPSKPKHAGVTMMVIDMEAKEVEVRPLRQATGGADFNEVFFEGVFVPDDDVVGAVDDGWSVARATLGNERVSIGGGSADLGRLDIVDLYRRKGQERPLFAHELGQLLAERLGMSAINLRSIERAVIGSGPGPEGNVTKLLTAESSQRAADFARRLLGVEAALGSGDGLAAGLSVLAGRAMSIAGGTSEITRNQIAERILGLPRDPLLSR
jgi:alkylation response protein AidB-like acyl-CoA dehydrogenase